MSTLKSNLIGDSAFYRRTFTIVLPIIVQNVITNVVSLLDNVMVGRVGTLEMSAVAIVNQLLFVFYLCIFGGVAAAGIFSTQFAGAKNTDGVRQCFRVKLIIAIAMFILGTAVFLIFPRELIGIYLSKDTSGEIAAITVAHAQSYLKIMVIGLIPFALSQAYSSTLRELGETKLPMLSSISAIIINLIFNWLLIFGKCGLPRLGVIGAAIATVMSRYAEFLIVAIFTHKQKSKYGFIVGAFRSLKISKELCRGIISRGAPILINEFFWSAGMAALLQCYSVRGLSVVAAANIASVVSNLFNVVFVSMGNAVSIMVGQHLGAKETERAKKTAWRLITLTVSACAVVGIIMAIFSPLIPHIYNTEPAVRKTATSFLFITAAIMPILSFAHNCYFILRSGGKTGITFLFDSGFTWFGSVLLAFTLVNFTDIPIVTVYLCVQLLEVIKSVIGFVLVKKGVWINNIIDK